LILKPFMFLEVWTQIQDWLRIIFIFTLITSSKNNEWIWALLSLAAIQLALVFIFDRIIIAHRPNLQISGYLLLLYPIYNVISLLFRFGGLLVNVFYYTPWNPPRIKIREKEERKELPPKVEIDHIREGSEEMYWHNIWVKPEEAYKALTKLPPSGRNKGKEAEEGSSSRPKSQSLKNKALMNSTKVAFNPLV